MFCISLHYAFTMPSIRYAIFALHNTQAFHNATNFTQQTRAVTFGQCTFTVNSTLTRGSCIVFQAKLLLQLDVVQQCETQLVRLSHLRWAHTASRVYNRVNGHWFCSGICCPNSGVADFPSLLQPNFPQVAVCGSLLQEEAVVAEPQVAIAQSEHQFLARDNRF